MEKERLRAISKSLTQVLFYPDTNITIQFMVFLTNGVALAPSQTIFQLCQNKQCSSKLNRISVITREN